MPIPTFQSIMLPLLQHLGDGRAHPNVDTHDAMARLFDLTDTEIAELLPSGNVPRFKNRVAWAKSHLKAAGLIESPRRGEYQITDAGRAVLGQVPDSIDMAFLDQFPGHAAFRSGRSEGTRAMPTIPQRDADALTPIEQIERGVVELRSALAEEILAAVSAATPRFLEQLVVDLLLAMGYGGSREDAGSAIGKSGDEGIDGVINEDRLGLDAIYIQAKRWKGSVGRPEIQAFAGALQGKKAKKGIFITTSTYTPEARQFVASIEARIVLIDGRQLADLMITHGVGVIAEKVYTIAKLNGDYFAEEGE